MHGYTHLLLVPPVLYNIDTYLCLSLVCYVSSRPIARARMLFFASQTQPREQISTAALQLPMAGFLLLYDIWRYKRSSNFLFS